VATACVVATFEWRVAGNRVEQARDEKPLELLDLVLFGLLAAIALRSLVWSALGHILAGQVDLLWQLAIAAAVGKILGGLCADRMGHRQWTLVSLTAAALLLGGGGEWTPALLVSTALFQSATPAMLAMLAARIPARPATAAGLGLGLAILLGGLPVVTDIGFSFSTSVSMLALPVCGAAFVYWLLHAIATSRRSNPGTLGGSSLQEQAVEDR
jgi:hypothetical protein